MSKQVTLALKDHVYSAMMETAAREGITLEELAVNRLSRQFEFNGTLRKIPITEKDADEADARFMSHFGSINSGDPHSADNDRIDADLAREYAATHEPE